jgi:hypothetical protein
MAQAAAEAARFAIRTSFPPALSHLYHRFDASSPAIGAE